MHTLPQPSHARTAAETGLQALDGAGSLKRDRGTCVDTLLPKVRYNGLSSASDTDDQDDDPCMEDDDWDVMVKRPSLGLEDYPLFGAQYLSDCPFDPFGSSATTNFMSNSNPLNLTNSTDGLSNGAPSHSNSGLNNNANSGLNNFNSTFNNGSGPGRNPNHEGSQSINGGGLKNSGILTSAAGAQSSPTSAATGQLSGHSNGSTAQHGSTARRGNAGSLAGGLMPAGRASVGAGAAGVGTSAVRAVGAAEGAVNVNGGSDSADTEGAMADMDGLGGSQDDPRSERLERRRKSNRESARRMRAFRAQQMNSLQQEAEWLRSQKHRLDAEQEAFERDYASALQDNMLLRKRLLHLHTLRDAAYSKQADVMAYAYSGMPQQMPADVRGTPYCDAYYEPEQEQYVMYY